MDGILENLFFAYPEEYALCLEVDQYLATLAFPVLENNIPTVRSNIRVESKYPSILVAYNLFNKISTCMKYLSDDFINQLIGKHRFNFVYDKQEI